MKKNNSIKAILSLTLVLVLIISSLGSIANNTKNESSSANSNHLSVKAVTKTETVTFNEPKLKSKCIDASENDFGDIALANESDEENHPAIVGNGMNALVAYEVANSQTYIKNSNDYGVTWSNPYEINISTDYIDYDSKSPNIDIKPGSNQVYGAVVSSYGNSGVYGYFKISDISSTITKVSKSSVDWTEIEKNGSPGEYYSFWGFSSPSIVNYDSEITPWVMGLIGSTNYTGIDGIGPCTKTPMFTFNDLDLPDELITIAWFPNIEHCSNLSIANEYGNNMVYGVCEIKNGSNQDLLFFRGNPVLWSPDDADLINQTITSNNNLLHPKITVNGNNIYIVAESEDGIVIYHTSNQGDSWNQINVTENILSPTDHPTYPNIVLDGSDWVCTFIESGNLSSTTSNNGGMNWTEPVMINDVNNSVVSGYSYTDIASKDQIVWTDNREGNQDIYYQLSYFPSIDIDVVNFSLSKENILFPTNNFMTIIVKNLGDGYVENVLVEVSYECDDGNITTIPQTAIIARIGSSQTKTVSTNLFALKLPDIFQAFIDFAGITNITVTIDPNQEKDDTDYNNNALTKSIEYKEIFLRFWRFENIFKIFKD